MQNSPKMERIISAVEQEMLKKGKIIEAGWVGYQLLLGRPITPHYTLDDRRRQDFFAGAQHMYTSFMRIFDEGEEPTRADLKRMEQLHNELEIFTKSVLEPLYNNSIKPKGSA